MRKKIVALILEKNGRFLVERRKSSAARDPGKIVFTAGHVKGRETLRAALKREIKEELNIDIINPVLVYRADFDGPEEKQRIYWFGCKQYRGRIKNMEAGELIWIKPTEANKLSYQVSRDALAALMKI